MRPGSRRARGSPTWGLLLLLGLSWPVGTKKFQGEWEFPHRVRRGTVGMEISETRNPMGQRTGPGGGFGKVSAGIAQGLSYL